MSTIFKGLAWVWLIIVTLILMTFVIDTNEQSYIGVAVVWMIFNIPTVITYGFGAVLKRI